MKKFIFICFATIGLGAIAYGAVTILDYNTRPPLVILKAETSVYKTAPADKGGLKLNSTDSPALSLLDKAKETEEGVETLRPPVSEPAPPPIEVEVPVADVPDNSTETASAITPAPESPAPEVPATESQASESPAPEVLATESQTSESDTAAVLDNGTQLDNAIQFYRVQFAAFKREADAKNTAAVLSTKHQSRLDGILLGHMHWDDWWRVVAEPMTRPDAHAFCSKFRAAGQDCLIKIVESPNG